MDARTAALAATNATTTSLLHVFLCVVPAASKGGSLVGAAAVRLSSSSYDSDLSSYRSFAAVSAPPKRPSFVPCLSTAKAGAGSWMGGLKEPGEYPVGQ